MTWVEKWEKEELGMTLRFLAWTKEWSCHLVRWGWLWGGKVWRKAEIRSSVLPVFNLRCQSDINGRCWTGTVVCTNAWSSRISLERHTRVVTVFTTFEATRLTEINEILRVERDQRIDIYWAPTMCQVMRLCTLRSNVRVTFFFFFFLPFLRLLLWHTEVPRLGVKSEL